MKQTRRQFLAATVVAAVAAGASLTAFKVHGADKLKTKPQPGNEPGPGCPGGGDWHGAWQTVCHRDIPCSDLTILQDGRAVAGTYPGNETYVPGWIDGKVTSDNRVVGKWYSTGRENEEVFNGDFEFRLTSDKKGFVGRFSHGFGKPLTEQWDGTYKGPPTCRTGEQT